MSAAPGGAADPFAAKLCDAIRKGVPYIDGTRKIPGAAPNDDAGRAVLIDTIAAAQHAGQIDPALAEQLLQDLATLCLVSLDTVMREFAAANKNQAPAKTEDGIALAFAAEAESHLHYDHDRGKWFEWTGDHWKMDKTQRAFDYARDVTRRFSRKSPHLAALTKIKTASEVEKAARADRALAVESSVWDADDWLLGVPGGVVDLRTGNIMPPDPARLMTKRTLVAPADPGTPHPLWSAFLDEATGGDADLIAFLQKVCGYCLTGDVTEEAIFFLCGDGGNGKGVFLRTVTAIMNDYAMAAGMAAFMVSKHDAHTTEIARLQGARLVTASETEEGRTWALARIKELTGNEQNITARFMHRDNFEFRPKLKLLFVGNHKPRLTMVDAAIARRLYLIPFTHKPATINQNLKEQLVAEYPAILRWMIEGCLAWRSKRLRQPAVVARATNQYLADENAFGNWMFECLELDPGAQTAAVDLFRSWTAWCEANNEYPGTNRRFPDRVLQELPSCRRTRTNRGVEIQGVRLRSQDRSRAPGPDTRSEAHKALQRELQFASYFVGKEVAQTDTGDRAALADLLGRMSAKAEAAKDGDLADIRQQFEAACGTMPDDLREQMGQAFAQAMEGAARFEARAADSPAQEERPVG